MRSREYNMQQVEIWAERCLDAKEAEYYHYGEEDFQDEFYCIYRMSDEEVSEAEDILDMAAKNPETKVYADALETMLSCRATRAERHRALDTLYDIDHRIYDAFDQDWEYATREGLEDEFANCVMVWLAESLCIDYDLLGVLSEEETA